MLYLLKEYCPGNRTWTEDEETDTCRQANRQTHRHAENERDSPLPKTTATTMAKTHRTSVTFITTSVTHKVTH